ncbi:MAG: glycoside hydrolase family 3 N-terminal domain-containing protein [Cypionkella sp.]
MTETAQAAAFVDLMLAQMTLGEKIGQFNYPGGSGIDTTGVSASVDVPTLIRRGQAGGASAGADVLERRATQEIAVNEGPNGIPLLIGHDCIQRYRTGGPIPLALSCSWDLNLIRRINEMTAREARADGVNLNWAPMLDICYDARWGRIAEGNGEFPYLGMKIAETIVRAYHGHDGNLARPDRFMATLKHFAGYGLAQAGRDYAGAEVSTSTMCRIMEPFRAGIKAGAGAVMVSFNTINDIPATANRALLQDVLCDRFGFDGLIVTDFTAIDPELVHHGIAASGREAAYLAFKAGVHIDLVSQSFLKHLGGLVTEGKSHPERFEDTEGAYGLGPVTEAEIDARCRTILLAKYRLGLFHDPYIGLDRLLRDHVTYTRESVALVREAAAKSCVLLKNDGALPLSPDLSRIAVIGPLADDRIDMQGTWAIDVVPDHSVTLLEGIRAAAKRGQVLHAKGCNIVDDARLASRLNVHNAWMPSVVIGPQSPQVMLEEAISIVAGADAVILCLGEAKEHTGESSTRADIGLPGAQSGLVKAVSAAARSAGIPLILIAMAGRPLALTEEVPLVDALIWTGQPGNEAGNGLADVVFGKTAPSGRLSLALPRSVGQLPLRTEDLPTGRPQSGSGVDIAGDDQVDAEGRHVFRKFTTASILEEPSTPLFPAGFGLTYTSFDYGAPRPDKTRLAGEDDVLTVRLAVTNTGTRAGRDLVQLYLRDPVASISRPVRELKGFEWISLAPGETGEVVFRITTEALRFWKGSTISDAVHVWEPGAFDVMIGPNAATVQSVQVVWLK